MDRTRKVGAALLILGTIGLLFESWLFDPASYLQVRDLWRTAPKRLGATSLMTAAAALGLLFLLIPRVYRILLAVPPATSGNFAPLGDALRLSDEHGVRAARPTEEVGKPEAGTDGTSARYQQLEPDEPNWYDLVTQMHTLADRQRRVEFRRRRDRRAGIVVAASIVALGVVGFRRTVIYASNPSSRELAVLALASGSALEYTPLSQLRPLIASAELSPQSAKRAEFGWRGLEGACHSLFVQPQGRGAFEASVDRLALTYPQLIWSGSSCVEFTDEFADRCQQITPPDAMLASLVCVALNNATARGADERVRNALRVLALTGLIESSLQASSGATGLSMRQSARAIAYISLAEEHGEWATDALREDSAFRDLRLVSATSGEALTRFDLLERAHSCYSGEPDRFTSRFSVLRAVNNLADIRLRAIRLWIDEYGKETWVGGKEIAHAAATVRFLREDCGLRGAQRFLKRTCQTILSLESEIEAPGAARREVYITIAEYYSLLGEYADSIDLPRAAAILGSPVILNNAVAATPDDGTPNRDEERRSVSMIAARGIAALSAARMCGAPTVDVLHSDTLTWLREAELDSNLIRDFMLPDE
ncbi:MAG: hypothetical protein AAGI22_05750 [Planctomycetota bacterium]